MSLLLLKQIIKLADFTIYLRLFTCLELHSFTRIMVPLLSNVCIKYDELSFCKVCDFQRNFFLLHCIFIEKYMWLKPKKKHENRLTLSDYRHTEVQWKSGKIMIFMHDLRMTYDNADWFFFLLFGQFVGNLRGRKAHFFFKSWNSIRLSVYCTGILVKKINHPKKMWLVYSATCIWH